MGASKDRKKRKEDISSGNSLKMQHLREEEAKARKSRNKYIAGGIIIAVLAIFILIFSSPLLYRDAKAVDVRSGDSAPRSYSAADYKYYNRSLYWQYYSNYNSTYGEYAQYLMPDETRLQEEAFDTMQELTMLTNKAEEEGFEFTDEMQEQVDSNVNSIVNSYTQAGYSNLDSYLASAYGKGVNEKVYRDNLRNVVYGNSYADYIREGYDFSTADIESYYGEHADDYDSVNYRYFFINGAAEEGGDADAAMGQAKTLADQFVAAVTDEQSFIDKAYESAADSDKETYSDDSATLRSSTKASLAEYGDWLFDSSRQEGDVTSVESESGYAILYYLGRETNHYNTVDVRHVLITPELPDRSHYDDDETYNADVEKAFDAAYDEAEALLNEWKSGEATEDSFAAMANEHSEDPGSEGGYYQIHKNQMVPEFEDWSFDPARQPGDTELVRTDYGWHIMYFVGEDLPYYQAMVKDTLTTDKFNEWEEGVLSDYELTTNWVFNYCT